MMSRSSLFAQRIENLSGSVAREILSRTEATDVVSFAGGLPGREVWAGLRLPPIEDEYFQYGPSEGDSELRNVFAGRVRDAGLNVSDRSVLVTSGAQQGLDLVAKLFLEKGRTVIVEEPTYLAALQVFRLFEARVVAVPLDGEGISMGKLQEAAETHGADLAYLNPSYHNPTGLVYSTERRKGLAAFFDRRNIALVEDDPYRDLSYDGATPPAIASFMKSGSWVYLNSLSKTLMPGLRLGCLACSEEFFTPLLKLKQAADLHSNRISQGIAGKLLSDEKFLARHVEKIRIAYGAKRNEMSRVLENWMQEIAEWTEPQGGMFFWLKLSRSVDLQKTLDLCLKRGVAFMPGDPFFAEATGRSRHIRLNFTHPALGQIEQGVRAIGECLEIVCLEK
ncbi:MAG: PLP-dependent aminotransferase family protein [Verrucomicrobiota bacterium]